MQPRMQFSSISNNREILQNGSIWHTAPKVVAEDPYEKFPHIDHSTLRVSYTRMLSHLAVHFEVCIHVTLISYRWLSSNRVKNQFLLLRFLFPF
jgi:hypothetical protein